MCLFFILIVSGILFLIQYFNFTLMDFTKNKYFLGIRVNFFFYCSSGNKIIVHKLFVNIKKFCIFLYDKTVLLYYMYLIYKIKIYSFILSSNH